MSRPRVDPGSPAETAQPPKPFHTVLALLEDGHFNHDATDNLTQLLAALSEHAAQTGKSKGEITVKLSIAIEDGIVDIVPELKVKAPKIKRGRSTFWLTPSNGLSTSNPKQQEMPLAAVPMPAKAEVAEPVTAVHKL